MIEGAEPLQTGGEHRHRFGLLIPSITAANTEAYAHGWFV